MPSCGSSPTSLVRLRKRRRLLLRQAAEWVHWCTARGMWRKRHSPNCDGIMGGMDAIGAWVTRAPSCWKPACDCGVGAKACRLAG